VNRIAAWADRGAAEHQVALPTMARQHQYVSDQQSLISIIDLEFALLSSPLQTRTRLGIATNYAAISFD
jgi:hypothetical protein